MQHRDMHTYSTKLTHQHTQMHTQIATHTHTHIHTDTHNHTHTQTLDRFHHESFFKRISDERKQLQGDRIHRNGA